MTDDKNYDEPESLDPENGNEESDYSRKSSEEETDDIQGDNAGKPGSKGSSEPESTPGKKDEDEVKSEHSDHVSDNQNTESESEENTRSQSEQGKQQEEFVEDDEPVMSEPAEEKIPFKKRVREYYQERKNKYLIWFLIFLFFFTLFLPRIVVFVEAGEAAVLFKRFQDGIVLDRTYGEGVHLIYPWDHMAIYNVRYQNFRDNFEVLSNDGLKINVQFEMRYRPVYSTLPILHREVGPNYAEKIVQPEVRAVIREVFGQYLPNEIYGSEKFIIENTVQGAIAKVGQRFVTLDNLMIKKIQLPIVVETAIEQKLRQEQRAQEFQYRIDREVQEAERKRIEAQGIRDFQNLITEGITEEYLRFKGIEATLELAKSNNSKIIMIGGGEGGLPVILDATSRSGGGTMTDGGNTMTLSEREQHFRAVDMAEREPGDPIEVFYDEPASSSGMTNARPDSQAGDPDDVLGYRSDEMIEHESHLDEPRDDSIIFKDSRSHPGNFIQDYTFRDSRGNIRIPFRNNQGSGSGSANNNNNNNRDRNSSGNSNHNENSN